jgi:hypothetical protein
MNLLKEILVEGTLGSLKSIYSIALIVIPLMLFMEIAKAIKLLDLMSHLFKPITRFFSANDHSAFPLAVGLIFGISYGAGVLIKSSEDGMIDGRSMAIISIFLAACHALVEDTLLFVAIGSVGWIIIVVRTLTAVLMTLLASRLIKNI